jgi:hypothetical protein
MDYWLIGTFVHEWAVGLMVSSDVPGPAQSWKPGPAGPYVGQAKPSPKCRPSKGFGLAQDSSKPEPAAQVRALVAPQTFSHVVLFIR